MKQGWEIKKLGEVCTFCSGYTPKESELLECGAVPYFKVSDMNHCDNLKYLTHTSLFLEDGCKVYPKHTIVFPKNGAAISTNKKRILAQDSVVDLNTGGVVANDALVYFEYLYLYFLNLDFRLHTRRGAVPTLDIAELKNKSILVPPREEQERIVAELDCLSGVIEKKREQLKQLDALAQSIFYQMFGDPITNEKGWEVKKLEEVCHKIGDGLHGTPKYDEDGGVAFINGNNLIDGKIVITDRTLFVNDIEAQKYRIDMDANTILLSINGTLGRTAIFRNENVILGKSACYCNINNTFLITKFVEHLMNSLSFKGFLEDNSSKSTIKNVGLKAIRGYGIILPPLTLQQEFADKIEAIEKQKELIKKSISEVEDLFNSRMSYYFN